MLLGKQTLQTCKGIGSIYKSSLRAEYRIRSAALASGNSSGASSSNSTITAVDTAAGNGHSSDNNHQTQQQQEQHPQPVPQSTHQQQQRPSQHTHLLKNAVRHSSQQVRKNPQVAPMQQFQVVSETPVHSRYLTVFDRKVKFRASENPSESRVLDFDIVGHPQANFCFAVTFPFHPYKDGRKSGEVTLIREYCQGPNALMYCLPTGGLDPRRHADVAECAARELSEEAWLTGGSWHRLIPADHPGLPEVKWCMNRFVPFLVVDPEKDLNPGNRDAEEASMEVLRMPLDQFRRLMVSGELMLPSITTAYMALDRLRDEGLL